MASLSFVILALLLICSIVCATRLVIDRKYNYATKYADLPSPKSGSGKKAQASEASLEKASRKVDQFSFASNATFKLRYLVNDTWWTSHGPIFFYTGNEGDIEMFAQNTGFMWDIAPEFGALLVFAEHRYYGQSLPFGNASYSDPHHLGLLTSAQALEDFVDVIAAIKSNANAAHSHVVAFGGSYGGMLSAWFRMKYPHIVSGAIAASAPILQFPGSTPCDAFGQIVTSDFSAVSRDCSESIRKSWGAINRVTANADGKGWLSKSWQLCKPLGADSDVKTLKDWLTAVLTNLAMVDYPYAADFLAPLPAYPIKAVCSHLRNSSLTDRPLLEALRRAIGVYSNYTGSAKCLDVEQNATPALGVRGWDFQLCTEMVMPVCCDGKKDFFEPSAWNMKSYADGCFKRWGVRPDPSLIVHRFGVHIKELSTASNIVFSNGLLDPCSSGGVMKNLSGTAIAIIIPEAAHHLDLRGSNPADPYSVVLARNVHRDAIRTWVNQDHDNSLDSIFK